MKKIVILGGTFDPIHYQHIKIAKVAYQKLAADEVWILPTKRNPFKKNTIASDQERLAMISIAIKSYPFIILNDYEITRKESTNYTIDTIKSFTTNYQDHQFYFLIGSDNLASLDQWKQIAELVNMVQFVVVNRKQFPKKIKIMKQFNCISLTVRPGCNLSSTKIRNGEDISLLDPQVNDYINQNLIYHQVRLHQNMDNNRYLHSLNVGSMSLKLAAHHHINQKQALIAGTYHDLAKQWTINKLKAYLKSYYPQGLSFHPNIYHAFVGALYLKHHWKYHDQAIINAIWNHTTGSVSMSQLDLVVFLADKISIDRNFAYTEKLRALAFKDLNAAFVYYLQELRTVMVNNKIEITENFEAIYQSWTQNWNNHKIK